MPEMQRRAMPTTDEMQKWMYDTRFHFGFYLGFRVFKMQTRMTIFLIVFVPNHKLSDTISNS